MTLLRDPIDRMASYYFYNLKGDSEVTAPWHEYFSKRGITLVDFLEDDLLLTVFEGGQLQQLAGCLWSGEPCPDSDAELVEQAKRNLRSCVHVAIHERLEDSTRLVGVELDVGPVPPLRHLNSSDAAPIALPPELRERLEERFALELAVHRWATEHFEERLAAHGLEPVTGSGRRRATREPAPVPAAGERPEAEVVDPPVERAGIGDWISLLWEPAADTAVGAEFSDHPPVAVLPFDRVDGSSGSTFSAERHHEVDTGLNWIRVPAGLYQMELSVPCAPEGWSETTEWVVGFNLFWCLPPRPDAPNVPGVPAPPDALLSRFLSVPSGLQVALGGSVPLFASGVLHARRDDGHLCLMMGSNLPVRTSAGDRITLLLIRVG